MAAARLLASPNVIRRPIAARCVCNDALECRSTRTRNDTARAQRALSELCSAYRDPLLRCAIGVFAIGGLVLGGWAIVYYAMGGTGTGVHAMTGRMRGPEAQEFFRSFRTRMRPAWGIWAWAIWAMLWLPYWFA